MKIALVIVGVLVLVGLIQLAPEKSLTVPLVK